MDNHDLRYVICEKFFIQQYPVKKILKYSLTKNNISLLNWLLRDKLVDLRDVLQMALVLQKFDAIKWVHQREPELTLLDLPSIVNEIGPPELLAEAGRLDILQYLHETGMYIFNYQDILSLAIALGEGHLDIVRWLHDDIRVSLRGIEPLYGSPVDIARMTGNTELVEWVREKMK